MQCESIRKCNKKKSTRKNNSSKKNNNPLCVSPKCAKRAEERYGESSIDFNVTGFAESSYKCVLKLATSSGKKFARKVPTFLHRNRNSFPARRTHSRCNDSRDAPGASYSQRSHRHRNEKGGEASNDPQTPITHCGLVRGSTN